MYITIEILKTNFAFYHFEQNWNLYHLLNLCKMKYRTNMKSNFIYNDKNSTASCKVNIS